MNEEAKTNKIIYPALSEDAIVYRVIRNQKWIDYDTKSLNDYAYKLRYFPKNQDYEKNISVRIAEYCKLEKCLQDFQPCYGIAAITVGVIRSIELDVIQDSQEHGSIINIPNDKEDKYKARKIAQFLARKSELIWLPES